MGRPSSYTPEIAEEICERIANGESLNAICKSDRLPPESSVRQWVADDCGPGFAAKYASARATQTEHYVGRMIDVAADKTRDPKCRAVEIDAIKWIACKLIPRTYGEKLDVAHTGGIAVTISQADADL